MYIDEYVGVPLRLSEYARISQGLTLSGGGARARSGEWELRVATSSDVNDGWLDLNALRGKQISQNMFTERYLLRPYDTVVTARAEAVRAALVPPEVSRTVASTTLLVVRPNDPGSGMGHYLWYVLTSTQAKSQLKRLMTTSATITLLTARNLAEVEVPTPSARDLDLIAQLVEVSEAAYESAVKVARLRRETLRDALIDEMSRKAAPTA